MLSSEGLTHLLGIEMVDVTADSAAGRLVAGPAHRQPYGVVHGGLYCALVETLASAGAAMWAMSNNLAGVVGVSNTTDFLRAHREGPIRGIATPIHRGRTQQLWQVEVLRELDDKMLARGQVRLQNISDFDVIGGLGPHADRGWSAG